MRRHGRQLITVLAGTVGGGLIALGVASGSASTGSSTTTVVEHAGAPQTPSPLASSRALSVNQIYRQDSPGVVDVVATSQVRVPGFSFPSFPNIPNFPNIPGFPRVPGFPNLPGLGNGFRVPPTTQRSQGEGAGIVYDTRGDVLTDGHVVAHARTVIVTFQDGRRVAARVVGMDPSTDVAVLHVDVPASSLRPIPFADSSAAQVGDPVVAIGSPFGLPETTTSGIVSAVGRSIPAPDGFTITGAIQTDAPINPGNSGGPLLGVDGRVLGLADQIATNSGSSSGVGFGIPGNTVARIADTIIAGRPIRHAYLGVGLNPDSAGGPQVASVTAGSPAASAGIRQGDLITALDGRPVISTQQFIETVDSYAPGQSVTLTVRRGSRTLTITVKLGTRPQTLPNG